MGQKLDNDELFRIISVKDDCSSESVELHRRYVIMKSKFSPKFTIVTAYPMMFSSADLKYVELEMRHAILTDTASYHWEMSARTNAEWLERSKRTLEHIWKIEIEDSPRQDLKRP